MWIKGFEERYEITKDGSVFFHNNGNKVERKLVPDKNGYMTVNLKKDGKTYCKKIHREVGKTYIYPFSGEQINHINGIKSDNRVDNLEWCTLHENLKHMRETGLKQIGKKYVNNTSGYYGVRVTKSGKFTSILRRGYKNVYLGAFDNAEEASHMVQSMLLDELKGIPIREYKLLKVIYQIDINNNIVNEFNSIAEAELATGIANQSIGKVILGKLKLAGGFKWERKEIEKYV